MIISCLEMDKLILPLNWKIKPFDSKLINTLARNHPYQEAMFLVYKYYCSYIDEIGGDILNDIDYFKLLDRYYRYGITFEDGYCYPEKRLLYEKRKKRSPFDIGIRFEDDNIYPELLYVKEDFDETGPCTVRPTLFLNFLFHFEQTERYEIDILFD